MQTKISIITPNYNYRKYIGETIQSIIDQDYDNLEHIIIDDGSTDNSVFTIKEFQVKFHSKIKLIEQSNHGQTYSINKGLEQATGDIICWINSDDTFVKDTFHTVNEFFIKNKDVSILFGDLNIVDINGNFIYRKRHLPFNFISGCFNGFANIMSSNTVFWRKPLLDRVGLLDDSLICNMDGEFFSRLTRDENVHHISKPFANFRREELSIAAYKYDNWRKIVEKKSILSI